MTRPNSRWFLRCCAAGAVVLIFQAGVNAQDLALGSLSPAAALATSAENSPTFQVSPVPAGRQSHQTKLAGPWGLALTGSMSVPQPDVSWDQPLQDTSWNTEESWKWPLNSQLTVYGQVGANGDAWVDQQRQVVGKTGVAWKLPTFLSGDCQLRGGPTLTCTDSLLQTGFDNKSEWWVELQCQWPVPLPVPWPVKLEYQGSAMPTLNAPVPERVAQDVRMAFPLGDSGQLKLGAKHNWEYSPDQVKSWLEQMQLYVGLTLKR